MPSIEDAVIDGLRKTESLRNEVAVTAVAQFFETLPSQAYPAHDDVDVAGTKVYATLVETLLSSQSLQMLAAGRPLSDGKCASLRLGFRRLVPPIHFQEPARLLEINGVSVALAAALGAVLGAAVGLTLQMPFARLVFGLQEPFHILLFAVPACLIACPIGALIAVLVVFEVSKRPFVQRFLQAALGVTAITDLWWTFGGPGAWSQIWNTIRGNERFSGRLASIKRVLTYVAIILLLELGTRKATFQRESYKKQIESIVRQWLAGAAAILAALNADDVQEVKPPVEAERFVAIIGRRIIAVSRASPTTMNAAVQELVEAACNEGLEIPELEPPVCNQGKSVDTFPRSGELVKEEEAALRKGKDIPVPEPQPPKGKQGKSVEMFPWSDELVERYERWGHIEVGDQVYAERLPVIIGKKVLERGLVRKARKKA